MKSFIPFRLLLTLIVVWSSVTGLAANSGLVANDFCSGAIPMTLGQIYTVETTNATSTEDPTYICESSALKGVWFSYTPAKSGIVTVDTCDSTYSTVIGVYTGDCDSLSRVTEGCNNGNGSICNTGRASVTFNAQAGVSYKIMAGYGFPGNGGTLKIAVNTPPPLNDTCSAAYYLVEGTVYTTDTSNATSLGEPGSICGTPVGKGVWFRFTPIFDGPINLSTCDSSFDTVLEVYTGTCGSLTGVAGACNGGNGPSCNTSRASITFDGVGGVTYQVFVGGYDRASGILKILAMGLPKSPTTNDHCTDAKVIEAGIFYGLDTLGATSTGDPTPPCDATINKGVWCLYKPKNSGVVSIRTCDTEFDTAMAVYTGDCDSLVPVENGCNDNNGPACEWSSRASVKLTVAAGVTYRILVGGGDGSSGTIHIYITHPTPIWQETTVPFATGSSISEPTNNLVHLIDSTNDRLVTLDTTTGNFISSVQLQGEPTGAMCLSLDQRTLYVPLYAKRKIQIISLPDLTTKDLLPMIAQPQSVAFGSDHMLYVTAIGQILKIDPATGQSLGSVGGSVATQLLKSNPSGTKLYAMDLEVQSAAPKIREFAVVASSLPSFITGHFSEKSIDKDFVIAEDSNTLYATGVQDYGISVWDMASRTYQFWPYDATYGAAVAIIPGDSYVYGASGYENEPLIRRFNRLTGTVVETYDILAVKLTSGAVLDRSLQVTDNGKIFYARSEQRIGLIGATSLNTNLPLVKAWVDAGANRTVPAATQFDLNATTSGVVGAETYAWSKVEGPGDVQFSSPNKSNTTGYIDIPGEYTLQVAHASGGSTNYDRVSVTITAKPIRILETSVDETGRFNLLFDAPPDNHVIEASTNLVDWETIAHAFNAEGQYTVQDPMTNRVQRFYRIRRTD